MTILETPGWEDYELLDSGNGRRLERFGRYILNRPDPQALWDPHLSVESWNMANADFANETWKKEESFPQRWKLTYKNLAFWARLSPFKHTGIFPEQSLQWDWISRVILNSFQDPPKEMLNQVQHDKLQARNDNEGPNVLNLFAYTGIASLAAASAGAKVTHVDASKPAISWARENQELSGLSDKPIRWILDDALKFVNREIKRGVVYDGIIMDPPAYGHGPQGETWDFEKDFPVLLKACTQILSPNPLFVIVNAYAISSSALMLKNIMEDVLPKGQIEFGELAIKERTRDRLLSTGIFATWSGTIKKT